MAPRNPPAASPAPAGALQTAVAQQDAEEYSCNFCERGFKSCNGLSGHYNKHKNLDHETWVCCGPKGSKIRKGILQARCEGRPYEYKKRTWQARSKARTRALSPEPVMASQPRSAAPGPQARVVGQVIRVQGRGGLLVVKNQLADLILNNPRARLRETGPPVKIQRPGGLLVRRDFVALTDGAGKTGLVARAQEPGVGSSSNGFLESNFPASRLIRSIKKEIIIID